MGLEIVLNDILARGQDEQDAILAKANAERDRLLSEAEGKADELRAKRHHVANQKVDALRREIQSAAEFESRRRLLVVRREQTDDFRARVIQELASLPPDRTRALVERLAASARRELSRGVVHARPADLPMLAKNGYDKGRDLAIAGGFEVESADRTILLDYRFETLLENVWKRILSENQSLFEG